MKFDFRLRWTFFKVWKLVSRWMRSQSWLCPFIIIKKKFWRSNWCTYSLIMGQCLQKAYVYLWTWKIMNDCIFDCNLMPLLYWIIYEYGDLSSQLWEPNVHYASSVTNLVTKKILKLYPGLTCLFAGNVFKTLVSTKRQNTFIIKTGECKSL